MGRRERRAGGTLISSEDCRILQIEDRGLQPGSNTRLEPRRGRRIVSPSGHPPTLSDRGSSDFDLHLSLYPPCDALAVGVEVRHEGAKKLRSFAGPRVRLECRSASKSLLTHLIACLLAGRRDYVLACLLAYLLTFWPADLCITYLTYLIVSVSYPRTT